MTCPLCGSASIKTTKNDKRTGTKSKKECLDCGYTNSLIMFGKAKIKTVSLTKDWDLYDDNN